MKPFDQVIILNMWINGDRFDVGGRYIETMASGPKKGFLKVNVNTRDLYFEPSRVMQAELYHSYINNDIIPPGAAGRQHFVEGF